MSYLSKINDILSILIITLHSGGFCFIIGLFVYSGIDLLKNNNILKGIVVSLFSIAFFVMSIMAYRKDDAAPIAYIELV